MSDNNQLVVKRRKTWLEKYLDYTKDSEAPERFHFWSGLTVLGHALGRKTWLDMVFFTLYPGQIWTVLVGPQGARKSTSLGIAIRLLRHLPNSNVLANKMSAQALVDSLEPRTIVDAKNRMSLTDSVGLLGSTELSALLPKQNYVEELIPTLTDLFDCPKEWSYKTRGRGEVVLKNVLITILAASTPDWLNTNIPENAHGGGFLSRFLFVWHPKIIRLNPLPTKDKTLERLEKELIAELLLFNSLKGEFKLSNDAQAWYISWYQAWHKKPDLDYEGFKGGFAARRPTHLLRIAMCIAASNRRTLIIEKEDLEIADLRLQDLEDVMHNCFEQGSSQNQRVSISGTMKAVLEYFRRKNCTLTTRDVYRALWRRTNSLQEVELAIQNLVSVEELVAIQYGKQIGFRIYTRE